MQEVSRRQALFLHFVSFKPQLDTVKPRLSGLIGTSVNSPDNRGSIVIPKRLKYTEIH